MNDKIDWVLVPREPTEAMRRRGADRWIEANDEAVTRKDEEESARCAWAAMLAAAPKPEAQAAWKVLQIGNYGAAYDPPNARRAFTYGHQPGNVLASRLGSAANNAVAARAGDSIDRGLSLLKFLQEEGFGVFQVDPAAALYTPASHDAQQDTSPEYRRGWLAGVESMRQELAQQPAVAPPHFIKVRDAVHGTSTVSKVFPGDVIAEEYDATSVADVDEAMKERGVRALEAYIKANPNRERYGYSYLGAVTEILLAALTPAATPAVAYPTGSDREVLLYLMQQFDTETWECRCGHSESTADMDSADYLRRYLAAQKEGSGNG